MIIFSRSRNVSPRQSASGPSGGNGLPPTSVINRTSNEAWVCPDDRQLALRAKYEPTFVLNFSSLIESYYPTYTLKSILRLLEQFCQQIWRKTVDFLVNSPKISSDCSIDPHVGFRPHESSSPIPRCQVETLSLCRPHVPCCTYFIVVLWMYICVQSRPKSTCVWWHEFIPSGRGKEIIDNSD
jgi:hypothetical protein